MRLGIDLGGTKIEIVLLDATGAIRYRARTPTPQGDYEATLQAVARLVREAEQILNPPEKLPLGMGIPGSIAPRSGLIQNANSTCLIGRDLRGDLSRLLERPVRLANDADCFTLSEATDGAGADAETVFGVILGTGVGGGITIGGRLITGPNAIAGEWGHNPLPWPRPDDGLAAPCYCGRSGCIETYLSGPALTRQYRQATGTPLIPREIAARAAEGDSAAEALLSGYEDRLARALAMVINILDPHAVILGGGLSNLTRLYQNVPRLWGRYVFSAATPATRLLPARFGDSSGVRGAAWLWS
ncbi:MAG: ROK family protein [Magnetococcales bacterium]|nr:ROK family protein [Magnetococcales bacterium]